MQQKSGTSTSDGGMTLVEIFIVILIISIVALISIPRFTRATDRARITAALDELHYVRRALSMYQAERGYFPEFNGADYHTLKSILVDDFGHPYMSLPDTPEFDLSSFTYTSNGDTYYIRVKAKDTKGTWIHASQNGIEVVE